MKKKYCLLLAVMMIATLTNAQEKKFSPEQFDAELQKFIVWDAKLTPEEAAKFFPLYWEMQKKQRELYEKQQHIAKNKPADDKGCRQIIKERDEIICLQPLSRICAGFEAPTRTDVTAS